ncbi:MAG: endonuclease III [SAR202 cluster bacterium]|jgi:endonuclease III|nr:endonuclease III [SAR202 cluster bacterium]
MTSQPRAIYRVLTKTYPDVRCELDFKTPFQLLCATVLSAQCTDKRVNRVTPKLFKKFGTPKKMAGADLLVIEELIHSTGFFRSKARSLKGLSIKIMDEYGGEVPPDLTQLVKLPGVGRKTANVVLGHAFDIPGITVDTHFGRLSRRFGWSKSMDPVKVEFEVGALIARNEWTNLSQRMIWHGRRICHSRKPACAACPLAKLCPSFGIGEMDKVKAMALVKRDEDFQ